jgi:hypothetical protein
VALGAVLTAATLGTTMAVRWVRVYRETSALRQAAAAEAAAGQPLVSASGPGSASSQVVERTATARQLATLGRAPAIGPPERNFPLPVVVGHGIFAGTTVALVLLTALGVGGS